MNNYTRKKLYLLMIMSLIITFTLAACGGGTGSDKKGSTATPKQTAATQASAKPAEPTPMPKSITLLVGISGTDVTKIPEINIPAVEYQKLHPNVKFEFSGADDAEHRKKLEAMVNSNAIVYDLFWLTSETASVYAKKGVLGDITSNFNAELKSAFIPGAMEAATFDGKIYGIPSKVGLHGWFYNKALFDKFSVKIPETYDELVSAVKVFKKNNIVTIAQTGKDVDRIWGYSLFLQRYNWGAMEKDLLVTKTQKFNNPDFVKLWTKLQELGQLGAFPNNMTTVNYTQALEMFQGGNAAMITTGSWAVPTMESSAIAKDIVFNWGVTFPDGIVDQKIGVKVINTAYYVSAATAKDTEKVKVIMDFFKFRSSPEMTKMISEAGSFPPTKATGEIKVGPVQKQLIEKMNDNYRGVGQLEGNLALNSGADMNTTYYNNLIGVMAGLVKPEEGLSNIDKAMDKYRK